MKHFLVIILLVSVIFSNSSITFAEHKSFSDVKKNDWYFNLINWGVENKIINGYPDGTFKPNKEVSEKEFLTMVANFNEIKMNPYDYAKSKHIPLLYKLDLPLTRQEMATYITAFMGFTESGKEAVEFLLRNNLASGVTSNDYNGFKPNKSLTRAEVLAFIQRVTKHPDYNLTKGLIETPDVKYPLEVIFNGDNYKNFLEVTKNLKAVQMVAKSNIFLSEHIYPPGFSTLELNSSKTPPITSYISMGVANYGVDGARQPNSNKDLINQVTLFINYIELRQTPQAYLLEDAANEFLGLYLEKEEDIQFVLKQYENLEKDYIENHNSKKTKIPTSSSMYTIYVETGALYILTKEDEQYFLP
ncbi:MAG TPA: S-layer homology domain-containing protein [Bacillales bacterium]|nr:S-layer homology domain-containing protein [Bacillales bacterium]